jgi:hypothetical protein
MEQERPLRPRRERPSALYRLVAHPERQSRCDRSVEKDRPGCVQLNLIGRISPRRRLRLPVWPSPDARTFGTGDKGLHPDDFQSRRSRIHNRPRLCRSSGTRPSSRPRLGSAARRTDGADTYRGTRGWAHRQVGDRAGATGMSDTSRTARYWQDDRATPGESRAGDDAGGRRS